MCLRRYRWVLGSLILAPTLASALAPIWWAISIGAHLAILAIPFVTGTVTPAMPAGTTQVRIHLDAPYETPTGWTDAETPPPTITDNSQHGGAYASGVQMKMGTSVVIGLTDCVDASTPGCSATDEQFMTALEGAYSWDYDETRFQWIRTNNYSNPLSMAGRQCTVDYQYVYDASGGTRGTAYKYDCWWVNENACPAGYTLQADRTCALFDVAAADWPSDGVCDATKLDGSNSVTFASRDPDCPAGSAPGVYIYEEDRTVEVTAMGTGVDVTQTDGGSVGTYQESFSVGDDGYVTSYTGNVPGAPSGGGTGGTGGGTACDPATQNCSGIAPPSDFYQPNARTYQQVLQEFQQRMQSAPFVAAAANFFTLTLGNPTCPVWTLPETGLTPAIPIDMQCSSAMETVWPIVSGVLIATAGFIGFRWAFL